MNPTPRASRRRQLTLLGVVVAWIAAALGPTLIASAGVPLTGAAPSDAPAQATPVAEVVPSLASLPPVAIRPSPRPRSVDGRDEIDSGAPDPSASAPPPRCGPPPADVRPVRTVSHGSRATKVVALTFDDGYNPANTMRILATLRSLHTNATFFVTGRAVELFPGVWRQVAAAGFPIANHTYDHRRLEGLCYSVQLAELTRQEAAFRDAVGVDPMPLMRPPYGLRDRNTAIAARAAGDKAVVLWDVDTRDWSGLGSAAITRIATRGLNGSIVLMHTMYANTATALPNIIRAYRARGFTFVTVGELLGVPGPVPFGSGATSAGSPTAG